MNDREKLIAWIRGVSKFHEEAKEKWILGGKQGERPSLIESIADHLIANGVVVREKGEWILHMDGSSTCKKCRMNTKYSWDFDNSFNFCPHCGADMRKGGRANEM